VAKWDPLIGSLRGLDTGQSGGEQHIALGDAPLCDTGERLCGHSHFSASDTDAIRHRFVAHTHHLGAAALVDV
jgi:hypothetical protein